MEGRGEDTVLVRVYDEGTERMIDREQEKANMYIFGRSQTLVKGSCFRRPRVATPQSPKWKKNKSDSLSAP